MVYKISEFLKSYFERYCDLYLKEDSADITERAQIIYNQLMHKTPDMGNKENIMTKKLEMVATFLSYHKATNHKIDGNSIEIISRWIVDDYKWISYFTNMNKHGYVKPLYYKLYSKHSKKVEKHKLIGEWSGTWSYDINPDHRKEGGYYLTRNCPLKAFIHMHGYEELMPSICKFNYIFEEVFHAKLIRTQLESTGGKYCDHWFIPDQSKTAEIIRNLKKI